MDASADPSDVVVMICKLSMDFFWILSITPLNSLIYTVIVWQIQIVPFSYYHMYGTLTYPKFFRRLPYSRFGVDDIMSDLQSTLFNIIFQKNPLDELFLQSMRRRR